MTTTPTAERHFAESSLGELQRLAAGSQGVVYRTEKLKLNKQDSVYKQYKPDMSSSVNVAALEDMVAFLFSMTPDEGRQLLDMAAWPVRTIRVGARTVGFVMPEVPSQYWIGFRLPSGKISNTLAQFQYLLNTDAVLARAGHVVSDAKRLALLASVAHHLDFLHHRSVAVGDFSPKNLLFSAEASPHAYFVDCDAMALDGASVLPQLETPDWQIGTEFPRERLGTIESDRYKFGLLVLRTLARHQSTKSLKNLPGWAQPDLAEPLAAALGSDTAARPDAATWEVALQALLDEITAGRVRPTPAAVIGGKATGVPRQIRTPAKKAQPKPPTNQPKPPKNARASLVSARTRTPIPTPKPTPTPQQTLSPVPVGIGIVYAGRGSVLKLSLPRLAKGLFFAFIANGLFPVGLTVILGVLLVAVAELGAGFSLLPKNSERRKWSYSFAILGSAPLIILAINNHFRDSAFALAFTIPVFAYYLGNIIAIRRRGGAGRPKVVTVAPRPLLPWRW
jgi:hypothetical protein